MAISPAHIPLDGIVDAVTVGVGFVAAFLKAGWRWNTHAENSFSKLVVDFLNGTVVTPFLLMAGAVFNDTILSYLRSASPVSISIAGSIGLFFVLAELRK
ncbi:hypothetical protein [Bradyrhizobium sp.]|jgi:hypothetical protein|uniref:hypothetical protein n=1 Tax=Bradyrhizobium sp. TaxID=376 RepID=UPI002DFA7965|nr:hypothetical protein [Bradyrhizobium sp.]